MKNTIFTIVTVFSTATMAYADAEVAAPAVDPVSLTGKIETVIAENASDKYGATTTFGLDVGVTGVGFGGMDFAVGSDKDLELDEWHMGVDLGLAKVSYGDQGNIWIGAEGEQTIADPAMGESLKVSVGDATVALGMTDSAADVTDLSNIQATYSLGVLDGVSLTTALDYNMDSENTVLGAGVAGIDLGVASASGAFTYDMDASTWGYEAGVKNGGMVAYFNGDDTETFQNVGGGYDYTVANGVVVGADVAYNLNDEKFTPKVTASFSF